MTDGQAMDGHHRVVVIGAGFGGLFAAKELARYPVSVTVVDRTNHHLFQPLLYQVATGILSAGEIAPAVRDVLRRQRLTSVLMAEVTDIDLGRRQVTLRQLEAVRQLHYDSLIVAAGSQTSYFGHNELSRWAPGMKTIDDAMELRGRIFGAFEMAEAETDEDLRREWLTFAVVGAGPTGVEMAGQICELSHRALRRNFRRIDPRSARVLLFDGVNEVLPSFGHRVAARTALDLSRLGVEVHLGTMVTGVDAQGLDVRFADGSTRRFLARTKMWAAGVEASPLGVRLAEQAGVHTDRAGRVPVLPDCSLPGHPEVFVVGDLMTLDQLPGVAEVAMQSGRHAARIIGSRVHGDREHPVPGPPLRYRDFGQMATIARFKGVAKLGPIEVYGAAGWLAWLVVHLTFLTGFKNRVSALAHWGVSFLGRARSERTITLRQVLARVALEVLNRVPD
jgi:NADH dehydrogenase